MPVLALQQAPAIAEHLIEWSDNEPAKWFKLYLKERDGRYALVLAPPALRLRGGPAYAAVRGRLGKSLPVGLVDLTLLDPEDPFRLDSALIRNLGPFAVGDPGAPGAGAFLDRLLAEPSVPPSHASRLKQAPDGGAAGGGGGPAE